ncbi:MAG: hypothetical protein H6Q74_2787 [Firmicutes bacterium]|nr:hypothetical protein [Bacillota bacterium]
MKLILQRILLTLIICIALCQIAMAQEITVEGQGTTRDGAIADALRGAVEQAVGVFLDSTTVSNNYQIISDEIYINSQGFIQDYRVLSEKKGTPYVVTIQAIVNTTPNSELYTRLQKLHLIETMLRNPRIAVIIPESFQQTALPTAACETAVMQKLRESGFKHVFDSQQVSFNKNKQLIESILAGNLQDAKTLITTDELDFIIVGRAISQYVGDLYDSGVKSSRAHVDARILKVDTGEIIAVQTADASGVDIASRNAATKALMTAGSQLGDTLIPQLMQYAADPDKPIMLVFKQASFQKLSVVQNLLKEIPGVRSVILRSYSQGIAEITVTYPGATKTLIDAIENAAQFSVKIINITNSTAELTF